MVIVTIIEKGRQMIENRSQKLKNRYEEIRKRLNGGDVNIDLSSDVKIEGSEEEKKGIKIKVMTFLTAVVAFFETLPLFLSVVIWFVIILCVVVILIIIFMIMQALKVMQEAEVPDFKHDNDTKGVGSATCGIAWTDEELASKGMVLTDYEKNLYRMGILAKNAIGGYGGKKYLNYGSDDISTIMLLGIASTETGMRFYTGGKNYDITKIPSDIPENGAGYGFMGLSTRLNFESQFPSSVVKNVKSKYTPKGKMSYDAQYAPWALLMSAQHLDSKMSIVNRGIKNGKIEKILAEWGIVANKQEAKELIIHFLLQAQYHGSVIKDYDGYINFWAALFALSSPNDADRHFSNWSIPIDKKNDFSESSIREAILGDGGMKSLDNVSTPSALKYNPKATKIALNGKVINKPLWTYVWENAKNRKGIETAWRLAQHYSSIGGGAGDRVLNFHYGFNSYLQGNKVRSILEKKMQISGTSCGKDTVTPGNFKVTKGKGQAIINGKPTEEYIKEWYSKTKNSSAKALMDQLRKEWGTSSYLSDQNNLARKSGYKDLKYGVPFYGQGKKFGESFGTIRWHWAQGDTLNKSGCMIYSHAYVASALTGRLINPAEMCSIMLASDALVSAGIKGTSMPSVYKKMGLNAQYYANANANWDKITSTLEKGGLVVVRMHSGYFTRSPNHYVVLTGITKKDGKVLYSMYTSFNTEQSMQLYTKEKLKSNMHRDVVLVWK